MAQIDALPFAAALGYAEALRVMKLVPWNGLPLNEANPGGAVLARLASDYRDLA